MPRVEDGNGGSFGGVYLDMPPLSLMHFLLYNCSFSVLLLAVEQAFVIQSVSIY